MKSYTDIKQSKKLAEILPIESADMCYRAYMKEGGISDYLVSLCPHQFASWVSVPCWSLAALVEQLPAIEGGRPLISINLNGECDMSYIHALTVGSPYVHASNLLDACYEMIIKLREKDLL